MGAEIDARPPPAARTGIVIQARLGSTRLPGKVLLPIEDRPMLAWVVERCRVARSDEVIVATTEAEADEPIVSYCRANGVAFFRGSEDDVLDRYAQTAKAFRLDRVVRVTADCPLVDPRVIDELVEGLVRTGADYATNSMPLTFPHGTEASVMTRDALERSAREATSGAEREHVTHFIRTHESVFRIHRLTRVGDASHLRVTVDHPEDLEVVREVFRILRRTQRFGHIDELVELFAQNPALAPQNARFRPGEGLEKSLREDARAGERSKR